MNSAVGWERGFYGCHLVMKALKNGPRPASAMRGVLHAEGFSDAEIATILQALGGSRSVVVKKEGGVSMWSQNKTSFKLR